MKMSIQSKIMIIKNSQIAWHTTFNMCAKYLLQIGASVYSVSKWEENYQNCDRIPAYSGPYRHWTGNEPRHEKTCFCHMRTAKAQISLRIHTV